MSISGQKKKKKTGLDEVVWSRTAGWKEFW